MDAKSGATRFPFDSPATYHIRVQGRLPSGWSDRLEGMSISADSAENTPPITSLVGELTDQAALAGVLKTIYELHLAVLSVLRVEDETGNVTH